MNVEPCSVGPRGEVAAVRLDDRAADTTGPSIHGLGGEKRVEQPVGIARLITTPESLTATSTSPARLSERMTRARDGP